MSAQEWVWFVWSVWVDLQQRALYHKRDGGMMEGEVIQESWFDRADRLDMAIGAAEEPDEETWGTSPEDEASHRAMMELGGGPAPLKPEHQNTR